MIFEDVYTCVHMKTIFFFNFSVLRKKKICLLCVAAYQWRFFLYVARILLVTFS